MKNKLTSEQIEKWRLILSPNSRVVKTAPGIELNSAQIESWRNILISKVGAYAATAPDEEIQLARDIVQYNLDNDVY